MCITYSRFQIKTFIHVLTCTHLDKCVIKFDVGLLSATFAKLCVKIVPTQIICRLLSMERTGKKLLIYIARIN